MVPTTLENPPALMPPKPGFFGRNRETILRTLIPIGAAALPATLQRWLYLGAALGAIRPSSQTVSPKRREGPRRRWHARDPPEAV